MFSNLPLCRTLIQIEPPKREGPLTAVFRFASSARVDSFAPAHLALSGSLRESPDRLPKPPGSRETIWFGFISSQISQLEVGDGVAGECWMT